MCLNEFIGKQNKSSFTQRDRGKDSPQCKLYVELNFKFTKEYLVVLIAIGSIAVCMIRISCIVMITMPCIYFSQVALLLRDFSWNVKGYWFTLIFHLSKERLFICQSANSRSNIVSPILLFFWFYISSLSM